MHEPLLDASPPLRVGTVVTPPRSPLLASGMRVPQTPVTTGANGHGGGVGGGGGSSARRVTARAVLNSPALGRKYAPGDEANRARQRTLRLLLLLEFISSAGFAVALPSLWPYVQSLGGSATDLGWIVATGSFGSVLGNPLFGRLSDRFGAKPILLWTLVLGTAGSLVYSLATAPWMLLVGRVITGVGAGRVTVCQAAVVQITTEEERTPTMALLGGLSILGIAMGPAIGTAFAFVEFTAGPVKVTQYNSPGYAWVVASLVSLLLIAKYFKFVPVTQHSGTVSAAAEKAHGTPLRPSRSQQNLDRVAAVAAAADGLAPVLNISSGGDVAASATVTSQQTGAGGGGGAAAAVGSDLGRTPTTHNPMLATDGTGVGVTSLPAPSSPSLRSLRSVAVDPAHNVGTASLLSVAIDRDRSHTHSHAAHTHSTSAGTVDAAGTNGGGTGTATAKAVLPDGNGSASGGSGGDDADAVAGARVLCCSVSSAIKGYALFLQFSCTMAYIVAETLLPPIIDDDYHYGVMANGIIWTCAAAVGVLSYITLQVWSRGGGRGGTCSFSDSTLLLHSLLWFTSGVFLLSAFPFDVGLTDGTDDASHVLVLDRDVSLPHWRFIVGLTAIVLGFTHSDAVSLSIYSKWIDQGADHGKSMGNLMSVQALACMVGPIIGTQSYSSLDRNVFFVMTLVLGGAILATAAVWRPMHARDLAAAAAAAAKEREKEERERVAATPAGPHRGHAAAAAGAHHKHAADQLAAAASAAMHVPVAGGADAATADGGATTNAHMHTPKKPSSRALAGAAVAAGTNSPRAVSPAPQTPTQQQLRGVGAGDASYSTPPDGAAAAAAGRRVVLVADSGSLNSGSLVPGAATGTVAAAALGSPDAPHLHASHYQRQHTPPHGTAAAVGSVGGAAVVPAGSAGSDDVMVFVVPPARAGGSSAHVHAQPQAQHAAARDAVLADGIAEDDNAALLP